jgi:ubiquinone/menaquinone biosynthesis C-methylase UbiE
MFSNPSKNIAQLRLSHGMNVADLGAGTGAYTLAAAEIIGSGTVYAIDVRKEMLALLEREAQKLSAGNIRTIRGDIEIEGGTKIANNAIDACILSNVLFQIADKDACLKEIKRILKPKGKVLLVDWSGPWGGMGPAPEHVHSEGSAYALFEKHKWKPLQEISAGDHHYGIIFTYEN